MKRTFSVKTLCICGICIALCYVLPLALHSFGLGSVLSPLHLPVLLCGLLCGGFSGAVCGLVGPIVSSILSGMPPATGLVSMIPELVTYGLVSGILMKKVRTGKLYADLYVSLVPAMVLGRIVGGIAKAIFFAVMATGEVFTLGLWISGYFVGTFPGILVQLVLLPLIVTALIRARVIPHPYAKAV